MLSTIGSIASQNQLPVWDKYNVVVTHHYTWNNQLNYLGLYAEENVFEKYGKNNYDFSETNGFVTYGNIVTNDYYTVQYGNARLTNWVATSASETSYKRYEGNAVDTPTNSKGTLVQADIRAIDGTYPTDGVHTDGFWYTKRI